MEISIATLEDLQKVKEEIIEALSAKIDNDILHQAVRITTIFW